MLERVDYGAVYLVLFKNGQKYKSAPIELDRDSDPDAIADELHDVVGDSIRFYFHEPKEEK